MSDQEDKIANWQLYTLMGLMLLFGTCNTLLMKAQDNVDIGNNNTYTHPYVQCANMFVGELMCLIVYFIKKYSKKKKFNQYQVEIPLSPGTKIAQSIKLKTDINPLLLAIPACFDICGSTLMNIGLTLCPASIYQMMRGAIVIITAGMAFIFLGKKQYPHHFLALTLIVIGIALVGIAAQSDSSDSGSTSAGSALAGIIIILIAQCFAGGQFIVEEKLLGGYYLDPLYVVGLEGFWGCFIYAILLPIFQNVQCLKDNICDTQNGKIEDSLSAFQDMSNHPSIIYYSIGIIISISMFNATGVSITKYAAASQRATIDTSRTLFIWIFSLLFLGEKWSWVQFIAFIILVFGTLIYNEILILPANVFRYGTKKELEKRKKAETGILDEDQQLNIIGQGNQTDYMSSSPTALYDQNRNVRNIKRKAGERDNLILEHRHGANAIDDEIIINGYPSESDSNKKFPR